MKIKSIEYENFRNFKAPGKVKFSTDGKVTIIYGENGAGKTTFHQLFQWIIYGEVHFNKTASDKMYNLDFERNASIDQQFKVKGVIDFVHADEEYSMRREWVFQKGVFDTKRLSTSFTISRKDESKNWVRLPNPEEVVEQLLPSGLAEYFFFDGESMITDLKAKGKDSANSLRDALYLMLDLNIYDKAVKYIGDQDKKTTTLGTLFMSQVNSGSSNDLTTLIQKMDQAQSARDSKEQAEDKIKKDIKEKKDRIKTISEQIGNAKSQRDYEAQRTQAKKLRDDYLSFAKREYQYFGDELASAVPKLMMAKVIDKASKNIKMQAEGSSLPNGINVPLIDALLECDTCICGTPLTEKERAHLRELYNHLPPLGYDTLYQNFTNMAALWGKDYDRQKFEAFIKNAIDYLESARKQDEEIGRIEEKMKADRQYENLVVERRKLEDEVEEFEERKQNIHEEWLKANMLVKKLQKQINDLTSSAAENEIVKKKILIMEAVKEHFENILERKSVDYSKKLERTIQELLDVMLKAKRVVSVSPDFALRVADSYDDESKSEGQFATVSFAYIGGIFKLIQDEAILQNKEYPLVLDAPFSKLGDEPRQKVIETIPAYAPQIILLSKDSLQEDFDEDRIGNVYTIVSNSEQNIATIEEGYLWK